MTASIPSPTPVNSSVNIAAITGDAPAAVLLVDLTARAVVHVNPVAQQLAPDTGLPISIDAWSDAAGLRDLDGAELSDTDHPLSKVARSEPVSGQAVSAGAGSDLGRRREPLWVVALPMLDAPMLHDHALVVLLPLRDHHAAQAAIDAAAEQAQLRDRAVVATGLSFTVADAREPDMPLVWVNPAFTATTGYEFSDAVGRNCRFLQGPGTDPAAPKTLRAGLEAGESVTVTLLNYRKDGLAFWNQVAMSPIFGPGGQLTHYVGIQTDVSGRVASDEARDAALAAEQAARAQADASREQADAARLSADRAREQAETARRQAEAAQGQAERARAQAETSRLAAETSREQAEQARESAEEHRARLALLALATERLSGTLEVAECRQRLIELVVPQLGDWAAVLTTGSGGQVSEVTCTHRDPNQAPALAAVLDQLRRIRLSAPLQDLLLGGQPARRISDITPATTSPTSTSSTTTPATTTVAAASEHHDSAGDDVAGALTGDRSNANARADDGVDDGVDVPADDCAGGEEVLLLTNQLARELGVTSVLMVPLPGRESSNDMLVLARTTSDDPSPSLSGSGDAGGLDRTDSADGADAAGGPAHTDADLDIAVDLARRAGLILDNARLFEAQHRIASTLQASLLPDLPAIAGVQIAARYHAAEANAEVGGDFYEVIDLPDVGFAFAIGDVVGPDVYATAAMGHLKGLLRACAWDKTLETPADVLRRVDELIAAMGMTTMATLTYGHLVPAAGLGAGAGVGVGAGAGAGVRAGLGVGPGIEAVLVPAANPAANPEADAAVSLDEPSSAGSSQAPGATDATDGLESGWVLHYSSAGHPPLLVRERDGTVHVLDGAGGIPLGIDAAHPRATTAVHIAAGSIVLAYTDGLIERRDEILTVGLRRLADTVAAAPHDAVALCQYLLDELTDTSAATEPGLAPGSRVPSGSNTGARRGAVTHDDVALLALRL